MQHDTSLPTCAPSRPLDIRRDIIAGIRAGKCGSVLRLPVFGSSTNLSSSGDLIGSLPYFTGILGTTLHGDSSVLTGCEVSRDASTALLGKSTVMQYCASLPSSAHSSSRATVKLEAGTFFNCPPWFSSSLLFRPTRGVGLCPVVLSTERSLHVPPGPDGYRESLYLVSRSCGSSVSPWMLTFSSGWFLLCDCTIAASGPTNKGHGPHIAYLHGSDE